MHAQLARIAAVLAALTATLALTAGTAAADTYDIWVNTQQTRPCTPSERADWGAQPGDTCTAHPEAEGESYVNEDTPVECWPDPTAPDWVHRARRGMCNP